MHTVAIESQQFETNKADHATTAVDAVAVPAPPPATAQQLIPRVSNLRYRVSDLHSDTTSLSREVLVTALKEQTAALEQQSAQSLIEHLADDGVGWSAIAHMLGVSVPAVRKWRNGEGASPANRSAAAQLAALLDLLSEQFIIDDPASWLEIPLGGTPRTLADIYAAGRTDLILDYASGWLRPAEKLLDAFAPEWRGEPKREFETFTAADGQLGIRRIQT